MFCPKCGQEQVSESLRFCSGCGSKLNTVEEGLLKRLRGMALYGSCDIRNGRRLRWSELHAVTISDYAPGCCYVLSIVLA